MARQTRNRPGWSFQTISAIAVAVCTYAITIFEKTVKMQKNIFLFLLGLLGVIKLDAQELKAYQIFDKNKDSVSFAQMVKTLSHYDVVLFGEYHNNAIIHWLELKTEEALYALKGSGLILGAEMFETDNQAALDRYLGGNIDEKSLEDEARLWVNFHTDYKPLLDFARIHQIPFVATNIPRRYAAIVAKHGLDTLTQIPADEKRWMARMPIKVNMTTPGYRDMLSMMKDHAGDRAMDFVAAQAVKDATMASSIRKHFRRQHLFLHFNGDYHSKEYGGIYWYLKKRKKRWKIAVVSVGETDASNLSLPEEFVPTEFNIIIPEDMTKTY